MSEEDVVTVEIQFPPDLLYDMDEYATRHGYENQSALVSRALQLQAAEE